MYVYTLFRYKKIYFGMMSFTILYYLHDSRMKLIMIAQWEEQRYFSRTR